MSRIWGLVHSILSIWAITSFYLLTLIKGGAMPKWAEVIMIIAIVFHIVCMLWDAYKLGDILDKIDENDKEKEEDE